MIANSDSEDDWEEVDVDVSQQPIEITITAARKPQKKKSTSHADRLIRIECHKIHTICLLTNARIRNTWINDTLLHARLLSLTPLDLQNAFGKIQKSLVPIQGKRGRMFEAAVVKLVDWWTNSFFEVVPYGHIKNTTFDEVQRRLAVRNLVSVNANSDIESMSDAFDEEGEIIRSPKSLMKHALMRSGCRDTSAQLFTALCRALGVPARLVVSLQSIPWQSNAGGSIYPKTHGKGKGKTRADAAEVDEDDNSVGTSSTPSFHDLQFPGQGRQLSDSTAKSATAKGKDKAKPVVRLRHSQRKENVLGRSDSNTPNEPDPYSTPPTFWTEVFSRPDARWFPVDPIRGIVNKRKVFDPSPSPSVPPPLSQLRRSLHSPGQRRAHSSGHTPSSWRTSKDNRMLYVIALEEDGYGRDVTRRYALKYNAKVAKMQGGSATGGRTKRKAWWERVVNEITRPYRLHRDDLEDLELDVAQSREGMPVTMAGFKDHPVYVLPRHLKQTETIYPAPPETPEVGSFRGEPVYPRSSVVELKTAENWMRSEGRVVSAGCQSLKMVKVRAGTVSRMRELEVMAENLREAGVGQSQDIMQGMYARFQTEVFVPDPVINGKIPKNRFGNIDLYVPSMLPRGAVHIPYKGVSKIARQLGFDFAEAVTGFEFKKRRAYPVIEGVVVASENEGALLEAYWRAEKVAQEKAKEKKQERALKHWKRLIQGLRIRQRLQDQYGPGTSTQSASHSKVDGSQVHDEGKGTEGFIQSQGVSRRDNSLTRPEDVVQTFHLPGDKYVKATSHKNEADTEKWETLDGESSRDFSNYDFTTMDLDPLEEGIMPYSGATMTETTEHAFRSDSKNGEDTRDDSGLDVSSRSSSSRQQTQKIGETGPAALLRIRKRQRKDAVEEVEEEDSSPPKRGRRKAKQQAVAAAAPSQMSLRPRTGKSAPQLEEERRREKAFREAVGEYSDADT